MRCAMLALACALLSACQTAPAPQAAAPPFTLINLTDEYVAFYERSQGMERGQRVAAFKAEMEPIFPGFYNTDRVTTAFNVDAAVYDGMIARSFDTFDADRAKFVQTAAVFEAMLAPAREDFMRHFPDLAPMGDIYLIHSVGEMDGGTRMIRGARAFVFGADVMARLYAPGEERPFFQHEVFHVYHSQFFETCDEIWCQLWREGLAVYVSEQLNPGATDAQLGLVSPRPLRPEVDADLPKAVCAVRARFNSTDRADYAPIFLGQQSLEGLPPRFGYYVGYLAAREAGRTRTLQEMAHYRVEDARAVVDAALAALASCPN